MKWRTGQGGDTLRDWISCGAVAQRGSIASFSYILTPPRTHRQLRTWITQLMDSCHKVQDPSDSTLRTVRECIASFVRVLTHLAPTDTRRHLSTYHTDDMYHGWHQLDKKYDTLAPFHKVGCCVYGVFGSQPTLAPLVRVLAPADTPSRWLCDIYHELHSCLVSQGAATH